MSAGWTVEQPLQSHWLAISNVVQPQLRLRNPEARVHLSDPVRGNKLMG
jgi:hypothetical protein